MHSIEFSGEKIMNQSQDQMTIFEHTLVIWKNALGSTAAWEIARLTGSTHPYLAPLTLILCLQATVGQSLRFAVYRSAGTTLGVLMIGSFAKDIPLTAWALGVALLISMTLLKIFRLNDQLISQVTLSILFVLYFENQSTGYAWDRAKDTVIGAIVGALFVILLFPPNELKKLEQAFDTFAQNFVGTLNLVANALHQNLLHTVIDPYERLNALFDELQQISQLLNKIKQGLPFQPRSQFKAQQLEQRFYAIRNVCIHFAALIRTFNQTMTSEEREQWSHKIQYLTTVIPALIYEESPASPPFVKESPLLEFQPDVANHEFKQLLELLKRI
jgi:uncharacterized membrane protein YgaE (UPF0421/DUF939 family)